MKNIDTQTRAPGKLAIASGKMLTDAVSAILVSRGWSVERRYIAGHPPGKTSPHYVDIYAKKLNQEILVVTQWQDAPGSAIDKLPYKYISLAHAMKTCRINNGALVFSGKKMEENMLTGRHLDEMSEYLKLSKKIVVCHIDKFSSLVTRGKLLDAEHYH